VTAHLSCDNPAAAAPLSVDALAGFSLSPVASGAIDPVTWSVIWTNPALDGVLGDAVGDLAVEDLLAPEVTVRQVASLAAVASGKLAGIASDTTLLRRDGSRFGGYLTVGPLALADQIVLFFQIIPAAGATDTAEAPPAVARRRLEHAVERASRDAAAGGAVLLLATVEHLADIDEAFGYAIGDEVVAEIERRLQGTVRDTDTVIRTDRAEFGLVVRDITTAGHADGVATRLARMASYPVYTDAGAIEVTLTVGHLVLDAGVTEGSSALRQVCGELNRKRRGAHPLTHQTPLVAVA
jgi:diguanylate cyclase (GGDEF)-like protein